MNERDSTPEPKRMAAALRKIRHPKNSTPEARASTGLKDSELVFFMSDQFGEFVEQAHEPDSDPYTREMGRKALFGDMMYGADPKQLAAEARELGYKKNGQAIEWILRVVSEGAQYHQSTYEASLASDVEQAPADDSPVEITEQDSVESEVVCEVVNEVESAPQPIIGLYDTIREMFHKDRLQMQEFKAQSLLVVFGKARSTKSGKALRDTIAISLEDVIARSHALKENTQLLERFCGMYLGKLANDDSYDIYSGEFDKFVSEARAALYEHIADDDEARSAIESDIAHQLMKLHPTKKK